MRRIFWIFFLCLCAGNKVMPQCAPPAVPQTACTGTVMQNSVNINSGQTRYVGAGGGTFSGINMSGGRLIICGNTTLSSLNFNGGQIIINSGSTVTFASGINMGSSNQLYNYGNVIFSNGVTLGGTVYNAPGSFFTVLGTNSTFNGVTIINNGIMNFVDININSGASMCMGLGAQLNARNINNNPTNFMTAPSGFACISFNGSITGNGALTNSAGVNLCQHSGASDPPNRVIGTATVSKNCPSCMVVLPVKLSSFTGSRRNEQAELNWTTSYEQDVRSYTIGQSSDGKSFTAIKEIAALNQAGSYRTLVPLTADTYFRLQITDINGGVSFSSVIRVQSLPSDLELSVASNPVRSNTSVNITTRNAQQGVLLLTDNSGRMLRHIPVSAQKGDNQLMLDFGSVAKGQYFLRFQGSREISRTVSIIRM